MPFGLLDVVIRVGLVIATAVLFSIIFAAYLRLRNRKLLLIAMGFGVFFIHAIITLPELFFNIGYVIDENTHLLIHLVGLFFILVGILKD
ncbi:MAG: hypothetical protein ACM3UL_00825 [Ignavibacteria bacterium]